MGVLGMRLLCMLVDGAIACVWSRMRMRNELHMRTVVSSKQTTALLLLAILYHANTLPLVQYHQIQKLDLHST